MLVILLTQDDYVQPELNWYSEQILKEDIFLGHAFAKQGIQTKRVSWSDTNYPFETADKLIFRTTWDYFNRFDEFKQFLSQEAIQSKFINKYPSILWNCDKHYLMDLFAKGISIVPTIEMKNWDILLQALTDGPMIVKPFISGAARLTFKIDPEHSEQFKKTIEEAMQSEAFMIQPFMKAIQDDGEISAIMIQGQYSHAVKKVAKKGDFRVQDDHGGKAFAYSCSPDEIHFATEVIHACDSLPLYARVDFIRSQNQFFLMELELIEPELFFRFRPEACDDFVQAFLKFY